MVTTHIYGDATFPPDLECQAVSFVRIEWPFVFSGPKCLAKRIRSEHDPVHTTVAHVVIEEARTLISYATVVRTTIQCGEEMYQTYGPE